MTVRIIPRLDIKGPNLVKGIHLEGLRVLGKPEEFARLYYEAGADELLYQDAVASLYGRNSLLDIVERTAREIFIPLCVGGGLRTVDDIRRVLRAGADKVSINTAAIERPELITEAARSFGSSTVVVCLEVIKQSDGRYECFTDSGRQATGIDALEWAVRATELGAGELLITSVDRDGTGRGFDVALTKSIAAAVPTPVIAHGGAGTADHVVEIFEDAGADAACVASLLHYEAIHSIVFNDADFAGEGNVEFRRKGSAFSRVESVSLPTLKQHLATKGIDVRLPVDR
jgi:cyclase